MKKTILFILVIVLVSCTTPNVPVSTPTENIIPTTQTLAEVAILEPTEPPTMTPVPLTATLDVAHLPTSTPQPAATCPSIDKKVRLAVGPVFKDRKAPYHDARTAVLDFLNEGGDPKEVVNKLAEKNIFVSQLDLTHDGLLEIVLPSGYLTVFGCRDGKYVNLLDIPPSDSNMTAVPLVVQDLNQNGLLEFFVGQVFFLDEASYQIFEWDGTKLANIAPKEFSKTGSLLEITNHVIYTTGHSNAEKAALEGNWEIIDTDGNGLKDIVIRAGVFDNFIGSSDLEDSLILQWDGKTYTVGKVLKEATPTLTPTNTPLPFSATCSNKIPELRFHKQENARLDKAILDYLNAGGVPGKLGGLGLIKIY